MVEDCVVDERVVEVIVLLVRVVCLVYLRHCIKHDSSWQVHSAITEHESNHCLKGMLVPSPFKVAVLNGAL